MSIDLSEEMRKTVIYITLFVLALLLATPASYAQDPPFVLPKRSEILKLRSAVIKTTRGTVVVELYPHLAPWHVANFKYLADKGYYKGTVFHLRIDGFIVQGGGPRNNPFGSIGYKIPAEFSRTLHKRGTLGMSRVKDSGNSARSSDGSHFHILLNSAPHMDGQYTIFGEVRDGIEVVESIQQGDRILDVTVFVRPSGQAS